MAGRKSVLVDDMICAYDNKNRGRSELLLAGCGPWVTSSWPCPVGRVSRFPIGTSPSRSAYPALERSSRDRDLVKLRCPPHFERQRSDPLLCGTLLTLFLRSPRDILDPVVAKDHCSSVPAEVANSLLLALTSLLHQFSSISHFPRPASFEGPSARHSAPVSFCTRAGHS